MHKAGKIALWSIGVFIGATMLGGSAFWYLIGLGGDLDIEGRAEAVGATPEGLGDGWPAYGGDAGGNRY